MLTASAARRTGSACGLPVSEQTSHALGRAEIGVLMSTRLREGFTAVLCLAAVLVALIMADRRVREGLWLSLDRVGLSALGDRAYSLAETIAYGVGGQSVETALPLIFVAIALLLALFLVRS